MSSERSPFRATGAKTLTALASIAASVATVLAVFVAPGDNGPGSAQAAPSSVTRACRATQKGWDDQVRRQPAFVAAVRHARTPLAARDAIVNETQARIASSGAAMSSLRAVPSPGGEAGAGYVATLRAWSRNVKRLERYRDALGVASTVAAINHAARAHDRSRSAFENDAHTVMAGLQALGGEACELDPPPPTPVTHLREPGATPNVAPHAARLPGRDPATPIPPRTGPGAGTPHLVPGNASPETAPGHSPDVSPHDTPDVAPSPSPKRGPELEPRRLDPNVSPGLRPPPPNTDPGTAADDGGSTP